MFQSLIENYFQYGFNMHEESNHIYLHQRLMLYYGPDSGVRVHYRPEK